MNIQTIIHEIEYLLVFVLTMFRLVYSPAIFSSIMLLYKERDTLPFLSFRLLSGKGYQTKFLT